MGGVDTGGSGNLVLNISAVNGVNSLKKIRYYYKICSKSYLVLKYWGTVYQFAFNLFFKNIFWIRLDELFREKYYYSDYFAPVLMIFLDNSSNSNYTLSNDCIVYECVKTLINYASFYLELVTSIIEDLVF